MIPASITLAPAFLADILRGPGNGAPAAGKFHVLLRRDGAVIVPDVPHARSLAKGMIRLSRLNLPLLFVDGLEYDIGLIEGGAAVPAGNHWAVNREFLRRIPPGSMTESPAPAELQALLDGLLHNSHFRITVRLRDVEAQLAVTSIGADFPIFLARSRAEPGECRENENADDDGRYDPHRRTLLWLGAGNMERIRKTSLCCIGAGGLMNPFVISAMHHGFRHFVLIDDDRLDDGNLNRFIGGTRGEIGTHKVRLLARMLRRFDPLISVECIAERFPSKRSVRALAACDVAVCGVDNDFTRLNAQLTSLALSRTLYDMGSGIYLRDDASLSPEVDECGGQIRIALPGGPCLACMGMDPAAAVDFTRREMDLRRGYIIGTDITPPSVITVNQTVASICLKLLVDHITGTGPVTHHLRYDHKGLALHRVRSVKNPDCPVCGGR